MQAIANNPIATLSANNKRLSVGKKFLTTLPTIDATKMGTCVKTNASIAASKSQTDCIRCIIIIKNFKFYR
jgi:hypothetical protein